MTRSQLGRCHVCRLPGTPHDPLYTSPWQDRATGVVRPLSVHEGSCTTALEHTYQQQKEGDPMTPKTTTEATEASVTIDPNETDGAANLAVPEDVVDAEPMAEAERLPMITTRDVVEWVRAKTPVPQFDPEDVARAIAWEIITSDNLEAALASAEIRDVDDFQFQTLTVLSVKWQPSTVDDTSVPVYAVMHAVTDSGESVLVTCGGLNVLAVMVKADLAGEFPLPVRFTKQATNRGYNTWKVELVRAHQQTMDGEGQTF